MNLREHLEWIFQVDVLLFYPVALTASLHRDQKEPTWLFLSVLPAIGRRLGRKLTKAHDCTTGYVSVSWQHLQSQKAGVTYTGIPS